MAENETNDPFGLAVQARVLRSADGAPIGVPTDEEMVLINRFALEPLSADDVFVLTMAMSTSGLDSYGTHMTKATIDNFARNAGDGVPLMFNHQTGSLFNISPPEEPQGTIFWGEVQETGGSGERHAVIDGRSVQLGEHYRDEGLRTLEKAYLLRGHDPNGRPNERVIRSIVGGSQRSVSVGLTTAPTMAPGARYLCDICGDQLFAKGCKHMPSSMYEVENADGEVSLVMATAAIDGARQMEGSLVWYGAAPGAFIEKAARLYAEGDLSARDIAQLEHNYSARIVGATSYSIPDSVGRELVEDGVPEDPEPDEEPMLTAFNQLRTDFDELVEMLEESRDLLQESNRYVEFYGDLLTTLGLDPDTSLSDARQLLDSLGGQIRQGQVARESLIEDVVSARVRADGANTFSVEGYRERLLKLDWNELQVTLEEHNAAKRKRFVSGRPSGQTGDGGKKTRRYSVSDIAYQSM